MVGTTAGALHITTGIRHIAGTGIGTGVRHTIVDGITHIITITITTIRIVHHITVLLITDLHIRARVE